MRTILANIILIFFVLLIISCSRTNELNNSVVLSLSETNFSTSKEKNISLYVSITNSSNLKKLVIRKNTSGDSFVLNTIYSNEIKESSYHFNYTVTEDDPDEIYFIFQAFDNKNQFVDSKKAIIDNRSGIYISGLKQIARVTGKSLQGEVIPNPNNTDINYDVSGTDLGIMWQIEGNKIGLFFGDTFGKNFVTPANGGPKGTNWRSNVLAFSEDTNLDDGLTFCGMALDGTGNAREICAGVKNAPSLNYQTSIPTSAIRVAGVDYVHYMNIYNWSGSNASWLTNYSSLYVSQDNGNSWTRKQEVTFNRGSKFSQISYAKRNGYVYMIGTLAGRGGAAYLARILESDMLSMQKYEYWNGSSKQWIKGNEDNATAIIPAPVSETSLMYHEKYKRWIITYLKDTFTDNYAIVYREATELTQWGKERTLVKGSQYPGLYCAFMHPLKNNEDKLYFLMSLWNPYNVFLMSVDMEMYQ